LKSPGATAVFSPGGTFILEATNGTRTFSTDMGVGGSAAGALAATLPADGLSRFAFFVPDAVPEPSSIALLGTVLLGVAAVARKHLIFNEALTLGRTGESRAR
jgi:hypothetical protein